MISPLVFAGLLVTGMVLSTAVYEISQRLGSNDPFAIELACWWVFTDLVVLSKLRGWKVQSGIQMVREQPDVVLSFLVAVGVIVVMAAILLTRKDGGRFAVFDGLAERGIIGFMLRSNLARSVVSVFCSLHLALFLA